MVIQSGNEMFATIVHAGKTGSDKDLLHNSQYGSIVYNLSQQITSGAADDVVGLQFPIAPSQWTMIMDDGS